MSEPATHQYKFWGDQGSHIPLWQRILFFPLMVVGFWGVTLLSVLWLGPGVLREAPIVWWRMIRYGEGQERFEHGASRTGVDSHPPHSPPRRHQSQKGGRHTMTSHQVPIGQVTGLFASVEPDQFGQTVDDLFRAARSISNAVVDEVEQQGITTTQGAAVIANVTGCLFGWTEFHREVRPADLALMQLGQVHGQVHGDGQ